MDLLAVFFSFFNLSNSLRQSFPRQVDRESRGPQGERALEFSRIKYGGSIHKGLHRLSEKCSMDMF